MKNDNISPFCKDCPDPLKNCATSGCDKWRKAYIRNWNENIHRPCGTPTVVRDGKEYWQYPALGEA